MPQDKRKSIRYRSFVTCDDPKGIVECGAIRKSQTINCQKRVQQPNKLLSEVDKKQGNQNTVVVSTSLAVIKENKEMGVQRITREVSKGADKMNHVVNSLSQGKGQQDDIAKDLLKNALDLQESLIMLEKLKKEASSIMSKSRRKQKQKLEEGTFDGMLSVNRLGCVQQYEELHMGWQRPRKSSYEFKKAVRESLLRQSVITNPIFEEDFVHRKVDCSEMPSTSSSQSSSMVHSSNFAMSDCSTSSTASQRRQKKDSNLIVKLMGLESPPLSPRWYREGDKLLNLSKPVYDIDSPRARKPQFGAQELYKKQRTVEEILDSMNFKGLLRSCPVNEMHSKSNSPISEVFQFKDRLIDERPPIVIMKPSRYPCLNHEEPAMPRFWLREDVKPTSNTLSVEENIGSETGNVAGVTPMKKAAFASAKASVNLDPKPQKKQPVPRKVEKVTPTTRKEEDRKDAKSRGELCSRDQEKLTTPRLIKQKDGRFISKHHISSKQDISSTAILDNKNQEMCAISGQWRTSRRSRLTEANKNGLEKDRDAGYRKEIASTSDNDAALPTVNTMTFDRFPEHKWSKTCQVHIKDYDIDRQSYMSEVNEVIKHHPNTKEPTGDIVLAGTLEHCHRYDDNHSCYSEVTSVSTSERSLVSLMDGDGSSICEVTLVTTHENGVAVQTGDVVPPIRTDSGTKSPNEQDYGTSKSCLATRAKLKALLLSNPLFLSNLEELFDTQVHPDLVPCLKDEAVADVNRARVLTDYANEVMLLQSSQFPQAYLPQIWHCTSKSRSSLSLDRLLDEICNGIKDLRCYQRSVSDDTFSSDNLYLTLNRDLSFKSAIWETGWRRMFSQDEIEQVTSELDKAILGKLIEEVVSDFLVL